MEMVPIFILMDKDTKDNYFKVKDKEKVFFIMLMALVMMANGKTAKNKEEVNRVTPMEVYMQVNGVVIKETVMELYFYRIKKLQKDYGRTIKLFREKFKLKNIKENLIILIETDKVYILTQMGAFIVVLLSMEKKKGMEYTTIQMVIYMRVSLKMESNGETDFINIIQEIFIKVNFVVI